MNNTPLRYPGGKSIMTAFFESLIKLNGLKSPIVYAEPYAGGAGTAINLLLSGRVDKIRINDAAIGIYSFWSAIVNEGDKFINKIKKTDVSLPEWKKQRAIFKNSHKPSFELGFATFYLSRTNRSGILNAGPIGGQDPHHQAVANYKIDCRFNKKDLINRVNRIADLGDKIDVTNLDAMDFLKKIKSKNTLVYLDPPYYGQGKALYLNYYQHEDHVRLSNYLRCKANFNWVLSYDNVPTIIDLYSDLKLYKFDLSYTAQNVKAGSELLTHSENLQIPNNLVVNQKGRKIDLLAI